MPSKSSRAGRALRWWPLFLLTTSFGCGGLPALASSNFDRFAEDWKISGDANPVPELVAEGGNPNGHICATDEEEGTVWYFVAPYKGDFSRAYGRRVIYDLKQSQSFGLLKGDDVVLYGGGYELSFNVRENPGTKWTPYSVTISAEAGWQHRVSKVPATEEELKAVLSNVTSLSIRGEYSDGPDRGCLDNVYFGTP